MGHIKSLGNIRIKDKLIFMARPRKGKGVVVDKGRRIGGGFRAGPVGKCVCTVCGYMAMHKRGVPCYRTKCPKCGAVMTRAKVMKR